MVYLLSLCMSGCWALPGTSSQQVYHCVTMPMNNRKNSGTVPEFSPRNEKNGLCTQECYAVYGAQGCGSRSGNSKFVFPQLPYLAGKNLFLMANRVLSGEKVKCYKLPEL